MGEGESILQSILDTAVDSIITIDGRGIIESVNKATMERFGYAETELIGQNVSILMPPIKDPILPVVSQSSPFIRPNNSPPR